MGFELPCWESRQPGFTAVGALGWSHVHLTLPQLFERQGIAGMPHQWLLIKIHKMIYMSRHPSRSAMSSSLTIANVALLSVSKRSDVASKLACSISRRFFFMFSLWMSACLSALCGINNEVRDWSSKKYIKNQNAKRIYVFPATIFNSNTNVFSFMLFLTRKFGWFSYIPGRAIPKQWSSERKSNG